ncbi:MAG: hypothetical protein ABIP75_12725 [Pyrinomonadaceae bacterium]
MASTIDSVNEALNFSLDATISTNYWRRMVQALQADLEALFSPHYDYKVRSDEVEVYAGTSPLIQYRTFAERLVAEARRRQMGQDQTP